MAPLSGDGSGRDPAAARAKGSGRPGGRAAGAKRTALGHALAVERVIHAIATAPPARACGWRWRGRRGANREAARAQTFNLLISNDIAFSASGFHPLWSGFRHVLVGAMLLEKRPKALASVAHRPQTTTGCGVRWCNQPRLVRLAICKRTTSAKTTVPPGRPEEHAHMNSSRRRLGKFEPLWPAEAKVVSRISIHHHVVITEELPPETAASEARIRASFVKYLALGGELSG